MGLRHIINVKIVQKCIQIKLHLNKTAKVGKIKVRKFLKRFLKNKRETESI